MGDVRILGIDPGMSGAIALYSQAKPWQVSVHDMPIAGDSVDPVTLADLIASYSPSVAIIEQVGAMPKQGVASTFKFGRSYGIAIGVVGGLKVPVHFVHSTRWKRHFRLTSDKEESRAMAIRLWPKCAEAFRRKKDADRAEAALIARYHAETTRGGM